MTEQAFQIFGPVLSVGIFRTEEEAIALANDTSYGLGAGLHSSRSSLEETRFRSERWSRRRRQSMHASILCSRSRHGEHTPILGRILDLIINCVSLQVWVNQYNILNNNVPFGGKKQSGIGASYLLFYAPQNISRIQSVEHSAHMIRRPRTR